MLLQMLVSYFLICPLVVQIFLYKKELISMCYECRLMESYRKDAEEHGAVVALNCEVVGGNISGHGACLSTL